MSSLSLSSDSLLRVVDDLLSRADSIYPSPFADEDDEDPIDFGPSEEKAIRTSDTVRPQRNNA